MTKDKRATATGETLKDKYPAGTDWDGIDFEKLKGKNVADLLTEGLRTNPTGVALNFMGKKISFEELNELVNKVATSLQDMGVNKGTKVGLHMPNTPYYPVMLMGILRAGGTAVNYSPLYSEEELAIQIEDSGTDIMVTLNLNDFIDKSISLKKKGVLKDVIKCDLQDMLPSFKKTMFNLVKSSEVRKDDGNTINFNTLLDSDGKYTPVETSPDDIAVLQYTSGSTGLPKGAMLTHFNLAANSEQIAYFYGENNMKPSDATTIGRGTEKILGVVPDFHVLGLMTTLINPLQMGNETIVIANPRDIAGTLATIDKEKPTIAPLVPTLIRAYDEHPKNAWKALVAKRKDGLIKHIFNAVTKYPIFRNFSLTSMKGVVSGGAALPPATAASFEKMVGKANVIKQGYGLSETSPVAASNPGFGRNDPSTVGLPYPGTSIKIIDPANPDKTLTIGEVGEICIKGPQVFAGYYNKPEETAKVMTSDGYFRTGDLGKLDEDYYLHITGRSKRILIINGENISPEVVENKIAEHPAVLECVIIGLPDKRSGEASKALIRYRAEMPKPTEAELREFFATELTRAEIPKFIEVFEEEFPRKGDKTDWKALQDAERAKLLQTSQTIKSQEQAPTPK